MKQQQIGKVVSQIMGDRVDSSWKLKLGYIVHVGGDLVHSVVFWSGSGQYECSIRVASAAESLGDRKSDRWVKIVRCFNLEVGDTIVAKVEVIDATEQRREMLLGTECMYFGGYDDHDVITVIRIGRVRQQMVVFKEDVAKFPSQ